jgi:hypothetical protein
LGNNIEKFSEHKLLKITSVEQCFITECHSSLKILFILTLVYIHTKNYSLFQYLKNRLILGDMVNLPLEVIWFPEYIIAERYLSLRFKKKHSLYGFPYDCKKSSFCWR